MFFSYSTFFFLIWILTCDSYYLSTVMLLLAAIKSKLRSIWTMIELGQDRVWTESIVETVTGIKLEEEDSIDWVEGLLCATSEWSNFRPWTAIQTLSQEIPSIWNSIGTNHFIFLRNRPLSFELLTIFLWIVEILPCWIWQGKAILPSAEDRSVGALGAKYQRGSCGVLTERNQEPSSSYQRGKSLYRWSQLCG